MASRLTFALLLCSCANRSHPGSGKDITFGGTLQSTPVQLVPTSADHSELVALLREEGRIVALGPAGARELAAPEGCTSPVVFGFGDAGPRGAQLLVLDSACGGWAAAPNEGGGWSAQPWPDEVPDLVPADQIFFEDLDADGDQDLASATSAWVAGFVNEGGDEWRAFEQPLEAPLVNRSMTRNIGVAVTWQGERALMMQRPGELVLLSLSEGARARALPQTELDLLKAFDGFDQLTALPARATADCGLSALAAGFFAEVYRAPKPLVGLSLGRDGFVARRIPTRDQHVMALATTSGASGEFVGVIEGGEGGFYFELLERIGCDEFESRAIEPIELGIEGLVPLPDSPEQLAASSGEYLLGAEIEGTLLFSHFDGKNLRRFRVAVDSGWSFDESIERF